MDLELTYNNHFRFGYNGSAFNERTNPADKWWCEFGKIDYEVGDFRTECIKAAKLITASAAKVKKIPVLLYSGGIDSEVMIESFLAADVEFRIATLHFTDGSNDHDFGPAITYLSSLKKKPYQQIFQILELDIKRFYREGFAEHYADISKCVSPEMLSTMWLMDQIINAKHLSVPVVGISGSFNYYPSEFSFPVLGSGEPHLVKTIASDYVPGVSEYTHSAWFLNEKEIIAAWYRFLIARNAPGVAGFFQYTPGQILAWMKSPVMQDLIASKRIGKLGSVSSKVEHYRQYFDVEPREKYTGFEHLKELIDPYRAKLIERYGAWNNIHNINCVELSKLLLE